MCFHVAGKSTQVPAATVCPNSMEEYGVAKKNTFMKMFSFSKDQELELSP